MSGINNPQINNPHCFFCKQCGLYLFPDIGKSEQTEILLRVAKYAKNESTCSRLKDIKKSPTLSIFGLKSGNSGAPSGNLPFPASGSPRQDSVGGGSPRGQAISARMHKKIRGACYAVQIAEIQKTKPYPKNSDKALFGAPSGTRTLGPLIKSQLLYQLS